MDDLRVADWVIPGSELEERFSTTGGPGGQHANRSQTGVTLRFDVASSTLPDDTKNRLLDELGDFVEVSASDSRSQWRNRAIARQRMVSTLEEALHEAPQRRPTKKPRSADQRRLDHKRARSQIKRGRRKPDLDDIG